MNIKTVKSRQNGAALAIGMILLLIISAIGITSMKSTILQDKMASGLKNRENADAAALALLKAGERFLYDYYQLSNDTVLVPGIEAVIVPRSELSRRFRSERNLDEGFTHPYGVNLKEMFYLAEEPKYIIEHLGSVELTSSGSGGTIYTQSDGEPDDGTSGGSSGGSGQDSEIDTEAYRVISKANDNTGHLYTGFESVYSNVVR